MAGGVAGSRDHGYFAGEGCFAVGQDHSAEGFERVDLSDHVSVVLQVLVVEVVVYLGNVVRGVGEGEPGGAVLLGYVPADVVYVQVSNGDYFDFVD